MSRVREKVDCSVYEDCLKENRTININIDSDQFRVATVGCWGVYCNEGTYIKVKEKKGKREIKEIKRGQGLVSRLLKHSHEHFVQCSEFQKTPIYDMFLAGDNVYDLLKRIDEKEDVQTGYDMSKQLQDGFEQCFAQSGIQRFFIGIGNHDIKDCDILNTQFNYDNPLWNFPALYYNVVYNLHSYKINFIVMDTNMFDYENESEPAKDCQGKDFTVKQKDAQKAWISQQISEVQAKYNVIVGHIPYYANGHKAEKHPVYKSELADFIRKMNPDLYICADEHNQQIIKDPECNTTIVVCGSGGTELDPFAKDTKAIDGTLRAKSDFGFVLLHFTPNLYSIDFVDNEEKARRGWQ